MSHAVDWKLRLKCKIMSLFYPDLWLSEPYVGFGWVLEFDEVSGGWRVISRLLQSPSGRAHIPIGAMIFDLDEFSSQILYPDKKTAMQAIKTRTGEGKAGDEQRFLIVQSDRERFVTLSREVITTVIPTRWPVAPPNPSDQHNVRKAMGVCSRTGVWWSKWVITDEALDRLVR